MEAAKGKLKVIVHVGGMSQVQCAELAAHAQAIGADMIAAMAPCFFKPGSVDELIGFFKPIAASASRLPFYYYNMPSITGVSCRYTSSYRGQEANSQSGGSQVYS